jgi:hypothetical protein
MNRNDTNLLAPGEFGIVDIVAVERQARAMQARVMAELLRSGWNWLNDWLRRAPGGRTA